MADTIDTSKLVRNPVVTAWGPTKVVVERPRLWDRIALVAVLLLSIFMNFFQLGRNGYGNLYYAAGVRSMVDSLHNFFFVSYDPGGFVTVDKPALGFWLQAISTRLFGFTPFSIFFPQALSGVLAVLLLYCLVRRHFGVVAGLVAALALAVSPISVVTNRNNTIDSTLALALLLAAWAVIHAAESGKLRWLLLSAVFVGLGFNIKMSEAYLAVPALVMTYLLCAPRKLWTRIWHLALFVVVMFALSLSWVVAVDMVPADQRPYVGSTQGNSEVSLAFGYNGLNRLHIGNTRGRGPRPAPKKSTTPKGSSSKGTSTKKSTTPKASLSSTTAVAQTGAMTGTNPTTGTTGTIGAAGAPGSTAALVNRANPTRANPAQGFQGGGAFAEAGVPGVFRLFSSSLGGQIAWLLPFALFAIIALAWQRRFNFQRDHQQLGLVLWGLWLLTMAIFFTLDSSFHQYYMTEMAPGLSAMVGIGLMIMWRDYRVGGWRGWLLPFALAITAGAQIYMLASFPLWASWLSPIIGVLIVVAVLILLALRILPRLRVNGYRGRIASITLGLSMLALLIAPTIWSGYSVIHNTESSAPTAGPSTLESIIPPVRNTAARSTNNARVGQNGFGGFGVTSQTNAALISYLVAHQGSTKFLVATLNASTASPIILAVNKPVMALGGFSGTDPILTVNDLQALINNGTVRYFLFPAPRATQGTIAARPGSANNIVNWVSSHCNVVPASDLQVGKKHVNLGTNQLYDCAPAG